MDEAEDLIFNGHIRLARPADAHEAIGTSKVVSDRGEMSRVRAALRTCSHC
jgi:hypothetical protein